MFESNRSRCLNGVVSVVCLILSVIAAPAMAQSYRHSVLIDSDNNAATGCTVSSAAGSVSGVELRLDADVSGLPPMVTAVNRSECSGVAFAPPAAQGGGYPVALDGGIGGADAIELAMAFADLPGSGSTWRIAMLSESGNGADLLGPFTAAGLGNAPVPPATEAPELIPTMSPGTIIGLSVAMALLLLWGARRHRGLLSVLMICGSLSFVGLAWAAHFLADGNLGDWAGEAANASDPTGDASSGEMPIDIVAGFARREGDNRFFRIDVNDAESTNRTPAIANQGFAIDEDSANGAAVGTVVASDPDAGDTLAYAITAGNAAGIFAINAGSGAITVVDNSTLDHESASSHALTVNVTDDGTPVASSSATISVNVNDINEPPAIADQGFSVVEDSPNATVVGTVAASDPDSGAPFNTLGYAITAGNTGGAFAIDASGQLAVASTAAVSAANSPFSLTVQVSDGGAPALSASATVTITVIAINHAPGFNGGGDTSSDEDAGAQTVAGWATAISDGDGNVQNLSFNITANDNAALFLAGPAINPTSGDLTYTAAADANGVANLSVELMDDGGTANGGVDTSAPVNFSITVNPVNDAPTATADAQSTGEDTALNVPAPGVLGNDADVESDPLTALLDTSVSNGTLTLNADGSYAYTPNADFNGSDSFTYHASDGALDSMTVAVTITVNAVNDAPTAAADSYSTDEDTALNVTAPGVLGNDSDIEGDPLTAVLDADVSNGTLALNADGSFGYTPDADFNGSDSFSYHANDGGLDSSVVVVPITVNAVNDPPLAVADAATLTEDDPATAIDVLANDSDVDGGTMQVAGVAQPANGTVVITGGGTGLTYQPDPDYCNDGSPTDNFTYTLNGGSSTTVAVTVACVDDPAVAVADAATVNEDSGATAIDVLANDSDADGGAISVASVAQPGNGTVVISGGGSGLTYQPNPNYCNGGSPVDSFTYTITGGSSATVSVTVTCVDDPPTAVIDSATLTEDDPATAIDALANDSDPDGGAISIASVAQPANGAVVITGGGTGLTYQPDPDYCNDGSPADDFTYTLSPGGSSAAVSVTVTCINDPPVVPAPASFNVTGNVRIQVPDGGSDLLAGASDPEGTALSLAGTVPTSTAQGGDVAINTTTGSFSYNPPAGYEGADSFSYDVCDADGACTGTSVNLTVSDMIWFVDSAAAGGGDGRLATPFNDIDLLDAVNDGVGNHPAANEDIFLRGPVHDGRLTLLDGQRLFGEEASASLATLTGITLPSFSDPFPATGAASQQLFVVNANALTLASNNTLRGFEVQNTGSGTGITGSAFGTLTIEEMRIAGTGRALDLDNGVIAGAGFDSVISTSSAAEGIRINAVTGNLALGSGSIAGSTGTAFLATGALGTLTYSGSISKTTTGRLVEISGAGSGNVTLSGNLDCTASCSTGAGANGLLVSGRSGGNISISGATKVFRPDPASTNIQIRLLNNSGATVSISGVTAVGSNAVPVQGTAYEFTGGGNIDLSGNMDASTLNARILDIDGVTLSGNPGTGGFSSNGALGAGVPVIEITNSAAPGGVSFGEPILADHDDAGESGGGIRLVGNTGSYSFPNVTRIVSTDTPVLVASNAGTLSVGSGSTGAFSNSAGTAIDVQNTTIDAAGITAQSVSSFGGSNGIVLNNTGSGAFTVTGDGPNGTDGSGGRIFNISQRGISISNASNITLRNMNLFNVAITDNDASCTGLVNSSCHAGIHLSDVTTVVLDNISLDTSGQIGINGVNVNGLTLENSILSDCGDEVNEGCLQVFGLSGTSAISNSSIALPSERAAYIRNNGSPNLNLTVSGSTFSDTQLSGTGADGLELNFMGSSTATVDVVDSFFLRNRSNGLQVLAQDTSVVSVDVTGSTFDREAGIGIGMDLAASDTAGLDFNVIGNPLINSREGSAVNVFADGNAVIEGRINNNPAIQAGGAGTSGFGISVVTNENAQGTVMIDGNSVSNIGYDAAIRTLARLKVGGACGTGCTAGRLDATVTNNTTSVDAAGLYDIWVQSNDDNSICANVASNAASGAATAAFRERTNAANSMVMLQGFVTSAVATWNGNGNTPINLVSASNNGTLQGGTCNTPANPLP